MKRKEKMRRPVISFFCLSIIFFLGTKGLKTAEVYLDVSRSSAEKISVVLTPFSGDQDGKIREILFSDLQRSGLFSPFLSESTESPGAELSIRANCSLKSGLFYLEARVYNITGNRYLFGKQYQGEYFQIRTIIHIFTNDIVERITGEEGVALTRIAFISDESGSKEVYLADYDGQNKKKITSDKVIVTSPNWSADGKSLIYLSYLNYRTELFLHNLKNNERRSLSSYPGLNAFADVSKKGEIALTLSKDGDPEIYLMDENGFNLKRLTDHQGVDASPSWSPDGESLAFVSDRGGSPQIYILQKSTKKARRVTYQGSYNTSPAWSPRGNLIAYTSRLEGKFEIALLNLGDEKVEILTSGQGNKEDPSWAPNGRQIVFSKRVGYKSNLHILDIYTKESYPLIEGKGNYTSPAWSPK